MSLLLSSFVPLFDQIFQFTDAVCILSLKHLQIICVTDPCSVNCLKSEQIGFTMKTAETFVLETPPATE